MATLLHSIHTGSPISHATYHVVSLEFFRDIILVKDRIGPELDSLEGHHAILSLKLCDALGPLHHVVQVGRYHLRVGALGAFELLPGRDLARHGK